MAARDGLLTAKDLMVDYVRVPPEKSVKDALALIFKRNISTVLVTEGKQLKGIATLMDFTKKTPWGRKPLDEVKVSEIMTKDVVFVHPQDDIKKVVDYMYHLDVRVLPVILRNKVIGIITRGEIARLFAKKVGARYRVGDLITYRYRTKTLDDSIDDAVNDILTHMCHHVVVLDERKVVGIITVSDVLRHFYKGDGRGRKQSIESIMTKNPITASKKDRCDAAAAEMAKRRISVLPVLDEKGDFEAIITLKCFFKVLEV